jgi:hypothetical protein
MPGNCSAYLRFVLPLSLLATIFIGCSKDSGMQHQFTADGRVYRYCILEQNITDLDVDLLNITQVSTEHCDLMINNMLDSSLPMVIQWAEDGYARVSRNFGFSMTSQRPRIFYLAPAQYSFMGDSKSGAETRVGDPNNKNWVYIDAGSYGPERAFTRAVFAHELCHFVCYYLRGGVMPRFQEDLQQHSWSCSHFDEAVAQEEDLGHDSLSSSLQEAFPDGAYVTFDQMELVKGDHLTHGGILVCRALVQLLKNTGKTGALVRICASLGKMSVQEAIEVETGWTSAELHQKWFAYMNSLRLEQK